MEGATSMNRVYDLIFSLGGNCAAAHNLKIRRLRPYSLPFDWTYMVDERPIAWLISAIDSHMSGFC
ncbi:MAG: papain-like cysteine peptidase, partial [Kiritimatiellae bacterium]|nr:papain-like cysteine peptidase [Kiritimatiellia bacterium]